MDFTRSEIKQLRAQDLAARAASIRDIGTASLVEPAAAARGITPARIASLTAALDAYTPLMNLPRAQIADLDDLVIQFEDTTPGIRFATLRRQARSIIDARSGPATDPAPITLVT